MILALYRFFLRLPSFKGKARIEGWLRGVLAPRATPISGQIRMYLDPLEWLQIDLLTGRLTEPETIRFMESLLKEGDTFVDVGAHVGLHALFAAQSVGSTGRVVAIDPQPYNCDRLLRNAEASNLRNILVVPAAVGGEDSQIVLHSQNAFDKSRLSVHLDGPNELPFRFRVPLITLDSLFRELEIESVQLLKLDVEGYEPEVLRGMSAALSRIDNLIVECLFSSATETERSLATLEILRSAGFRLRDIRGSLFEPGANLPERNVWASRS